MHYRSGLGPTTLQCVSSGVCAVIVPDSLFAMQDFFFSPEAAEISRRGLFRPAPPSSPPAEPEPTRTPSSTALQFEDEDGLQLEQEYILEDFSALLLLSSGCCPPCFHP